MSGALSSGGCVAAIILELSCEASIEAILLLIRAQLFDAETEMPNTSARDPLLL